MISGLFSAIVILVVVGILLGLAFWVLDALAIPEPISRYARVLLVVVAALFVVGLLLNLIGVSTGVDVPKLG
jgi:hypothetical protein